MQYPKPDPILHRFFTPADIFQSVRHEFDIARHDETLVENAVEDVNEAATATSTARAPGHVGRHAELLGAHIRAATCGRAVQVCTRETRANVAVYLARSRTQEQTILF